MTIADDVRQEATKLRINDEAFIERVIKFREAQAEYRDTISQRCPDCSHLRAWSASSGKCTWRLGDQWDSHMCKCTYFEAVPRVV
jgi:hypothetical protein